MENFNFKICFHLKIHEGHLFHIIPLHFFFNKVKRAKRITDESVERKREQQKVLFFSLVNGLSNKSDQLKTAQNSH